jgi:hypothetical protein
MEDKKVEKVIQIIESNNPYILDYSIHDYVYPRNLSIRLNVVYNMPNDYYNQMINELSKHGTVYAEKVWQNKPTFDHL